MHTAARHTFHHYMMAVHTNYHFRQISVMIVAQAVLQWFVSVSHQMSTSAQVIIEWLHLPWTSSQLAIITTQPAGDFGHGFSCFVCYVEPKLAQPDAIWLFSLYMEE